MKLITRCEDTGCHRRKECLRASIQSESRIFHPVFLATPRKRNLCHKFILIGEQHE